MNRKNENEQELQAFRQSLKPYLGDHPSQEKPFFAKKVMRSIESLEADTQDTGYKLIIYRYLRIALFMGLLLFPTLTEAII